MKYFILTTFLILSLGCNGPKEIYEGGAELVKYHATPYVTQFSYKVTEGDTLQMALERDIIFASYETVEDGIIINIKVKHPK